LLPLIAFGGCLSSLVIRVRRSFVMEVCLYLEEVGVSDSCRRKKKKRSSMFFPNYQQTNKQTKSPTTSICVCLLAKKRRFLFFSGIGDIIYNKCWLTTNHPLCVCECVCATEISDEKEEGVVFRSVNNSYVRNK
jgi:hypothetical protein